MVVFTLGMLLYLLPWDEISKFINDTHRALEEHWFRIYDYAEGNQFLLFFVGNQVVTLGTLYTIGILFLPIDLTGKPRWLSKYKIMNTGTETFPIPVKSLIESLKGSLFNHFIAGPPCIALAQLARQWIGHDDSRRLPPFWRISVEFTILMLTTEVFAYYLHRLLHDRKYYKYIHKFHHDHTLPTAIMYQYAHWSEHIMLNIACMYLGAVLSGCHVFSMWLWLGLATFETTMGHCDFDFPIIGNFTTFHNYHHKLVNKNFGGIGLMDWWHGTIAKQRIADKYKDSNKQKPKSLNPKMWFMEFSKFPVSWWQ